MDDIYIIPRKQLRSLPPTGSLSLWVLLLLPVLLLQACNLVPTGVVRLSPSTEVSATITVAATSSATAAPTVTASSTPSPTFTETSTLTPTYTHTPTQTPLPPPVVFAVIGDYGLGTVNINQTADLIKSWEPDFIITLGDNNYPVGAPDHLDAAVGQFFHSYIYPYKGEYGEGADVNRFFPTLGNHDVLTDFGQSYLDYFTLPGNERYYDFVWGPVHLFAVNTTEGEPDGIRATSAQAVWLKEQLAASTAPWKVVYFHIAPYSSGLHGSTTWAQWPFGEWGADMVLSGHDHTYERLEIGGLTYIVNGLGGGGRYDFREIVEGSLVRYNNAYGAMRVEATSEYMLFQFINLAQEVIDQVELRQARDGN